MSRTTVVIGGGVIGLCCAYELRKRGRDVVVLEMGQNGRACSWGNAGWVVPSFAAPLPEPGLTWTSIKWMFRRDSPLYIDPIAAPRMAGWLFAFWRKCNATHMRTGTEALTRLNQRTLPLFDELEADGVPFEMHRGGMLYVFQTEAGLEHAAHGARTMHKAGMTPPQRLSAAELRGLEPALSPSIVGGYRYADERHVRPDTLTAGLALKLRERGADLREGVEVHGVARKGGAISALMTSAGEVRGDEFVLAAGAWSGLLAPRFGLRLPVQAGKGYSVTVDQPAVTIQRPLSLGEAKFGVTPFRGSLRFAGTMELSGFNTRLDPARVAAVRRQAERYIPGSLQGGAQTEWTGMRPLTPDGLPVIGRVPGAGNLYVATGHAMLGMTLGPATGRAIAELICDGATPADLTPFDVARFG